MRDDIILCGVGGQGTVLASRLLSDAAVAAGEPVRAAETIGMAQRGGSVTSHVRIGLGPHSPLIGYGEASVLIGFEPAEAARQLAYLAPDGTAVVATRPVVPASALTGGPAYDLGAVMDFLESCAARLVLVDVDEAASQLGTAKATNVVLLGAAASSGALSCGDAALRDAIARRVPERFLDLNMRALELGLAAGRA